MTILPLLAVWLEPVAPSAEIIQRAGLKVISSIKLSKSAPDILVKASCTRGGNCSYDRICTLLGEADKQLTEEETTNKVDSNPINISFFFIIVVNLISKLNYYKLYKTNFLYNYLTLLLKDIKRERILAPLSLNSLRKGIILSHEGRHALHNTDS